MKIYNEVTIDMNPESSTYGEHLSEDSCNYEGDVALCGGGGGDPRDLWNFAKAQPGDRFPRQLPSTHPVTGWGGKDLGAGEEFDWQGAYDRAYNTIQGYGSNNAQRESNRKSRARSMADQQARTHTVQNWYQPAYKSFVRAPIQEMIGQTPEAGTAGESIIAERGGVGAQSKFESLAGALERAGVEGGFAANLITEAIPSIGAGHSSIGAEGPMIVKESTGEIQEAALKMESEEQAYKDETERIESERTAAKKTKSEALAENAVARAQARRGELSDYEQATAKEATSGFAYSAPAAKGVEDFQTSQADSLRDIAMGRQDILKDFKGRQKELTSEYDTADTGLHTAKQEYNVTLQDVLAQTGELAGQLKAEGESLLTDWEAWPGTFAGQKYNPTGTTKGGYGMGSQPLFGETNDPVITDLSNLTSEVGAMANAMSDYLSTAVTTDDPLGIEE